MANRQTMEDLSRLSGDEKRALLARLLRERAEGEPVQDVAACDSPVSFPLSVGQLGLWYTFRRDPGVTAYNVFLPVRYRSSINLEALEKTIEELVRRHPALRTTFAENEATGEPFQSVQEDLAPGFQIRETPGLDNDSLKQLVKEEVSRPFDLTEGPLLRLAVFRVAEDDLVVVATAHHIVVDFWSLILLLDEIRSLYPKLAAGESPPRHSRSATYQRFVDAQTELLGSARGQELAEEWRGRIEAIRPVLESPTDFLRPDRFTHQADVFPLSFPPGISTRIKEIARHFSVTENVVVMAGLQAFLARFTGQDSFSIGTPFSGRTQHEFEKTVGFFVNMLPITTDVADDPTFADLIEIVGEKMVAALGSESLPLAEIVRRSGIPRDPSRHPLFQVSCTFEKAQLKEEQGRASFLLGDGQVFDDFAGLVQESFHIGIPTCLYDIEFVFEFDDQALRGMICYCKDLFCRDTIESMSEQFVVLLEQWLASPQRRINEVPWFVEARSTPDSDHESIQTFVEMLDQADHEILDQAKRFAGTLIRSGVEPGSFVPVYLATGRQAWVALFGVMFAGAVPIPIDARQPAVSSEILRRDAEIQFVVADRTDAWVSDLQASVITLQDIEDEDQPCVVRRRPEDLAYVVYTSGSTGRPKGVVVSQSAIANTMRWRLRATPSTKQDRTIVLLSHQFDAALAVVGTAVLQGTTTVWPEDNDNLDLDFLIDEIIENRITILPAVVSLMRVLAEHPRLSECRSIRQVWTGGESVPEYLPALIASKLDCEMWNFYGPTEAAIEVAAQRIDRIDPNRRMPIGKAIDGVRIEVVDDSLAPVPTGVVGQIVISGRALANGYLNRPDLTDKAFVRSKHISDASGKPERIYLTGDLGRRRKDGTLEFLTRIDHQVKLRGYRIELQEIERVIEGIDGVERAAAKVVRNHTAGERLAAYVQGDNLDVDSLRRLLSSRLPRFKLPSSITLLESIPVGTSGKVDRERLPEPAEIAALRREEQLPPRSKLEHFLRDRFARSIGQPDFAITTDYFEAGGTSLQAAILSSDLSRELGVNIPTSLLFDVSDVVAFSQRLVDLHEPSLRDRFGEDSIRVATVKSQGDGSLDSLLADFSTSRTEPPIFLIHPPGGIVQCYREIAACLSDGSSVVGVRSRGLHGEERLPASLSEMATDYVAAIRARQPMGPYLIGGWSLGGVAAIEVARQLVEAGEAVAGLVLLDSTVPERSESSEGTELPSAGSEYGIDLSLSELSELSEDDQLPFLYDHAEKLGVLNDETPKEVVYKVIGDLKRLFSHHVRLCQEYEVQPLDVAALLLRPNDVPFETDPRPDRGWRSLLRSVEVAYVPGHHHSMVRAEGAKAIAGEIARFAEAAFSKSIR